jgi:nucleotide-binding universal stress UspA family protein
MSSVPPPVHARVKNMFKNILLTTDFSACSQCTVPYARALAQFHGSTVHLLHVLGPEPTTGHLIPDIDSEDEEAKARTEMRALASCDAFKDIPHTELLKAGVVWDVVSEVIDEVGIDLVIVGTHGEQGLRHFILGSVAERILRNVTCPVLTIGPDIRRRGLAAGTVTTILCATDLSAASRNVFDHSVNLARISGAKLALLHAVEPDQAPETQLERLTANAERRLSSLAEECSDLPCRAIVLRGPAANVILSKANEISADLIVMGAHGGPAAAHIPWTPVHQVVAHALCPVMTLRD